MNVRSILKGSGLVTASAALIALVTLVGILVFTFYNISDRDGSASIREISAALTWDGTAYSFSGEDLLDDGHWAMLVNEDGQVVWSIRKPADVPEQYSLTDVASFTRWYLSDYPVQSWVRDDGLLVAGAPKGSIWKHDMAMDIETLMQIPLWFGGIFLLALGCVLLLAYFVVRRWFRQAQQTRDAARSDWINGVSHDIRTPLSMVMGYAAQMEGAADLPPERRRQAGIIRAQSQAIRDLVNDLKTFGFLFETLCVRDLRVFADALNGEVYHYRDKEGQECDAVIHLRNGRYGLIEIKLGGDRLIEEGAKSLKVMDEKIDTDKMYAPSFLITVC